MATKYYLDQPGLERLVDYINNGLDRKMNIGDIPENVVVTEDLEPYALKSDIPESADLSGYATKIELEDYATDADLEELANRVSGVYHYRGNVADLEALQAIENPEQGDVYNIGNTGMNAAWTGEVWDEFGAMVDLTPYALAEDIQAMSIPTVDSILYGGKSAVVSDVAGIAAMIANDEPVVTVVLNDDISGMSTLSIPEGKKVILDLGGNDVVASGMALNVEGGEVVLKNGNLTSSSNDAIMATNGATVVIDGANITSARRQGVYAKESEVIVNSGSITSQEAGIAGFKDSVITINGGTITGIDNGGIMGNGSGEGKPNDGRNLNIVMNGGKIIGHIQSNGYIACGVYMPNSGSFVMNGGEIESDGVGICMRGGLVHIGSDAKITATGTSGVTGKVGDSPVKVGPYAIVYDATSNYPGVDSLELIIDNGAQLSSKESNDIDIMLPEGVSPNITDNR